MKEIKNLKRELKLRLFANTLKVLATVVVGLLLVWGVAAQNLTIVGVGAVVLAGIFAVEGGVIFGLTIKHLIANRRKFKMTENREQTVKIGKNIQKEKDKAKKKEARLAKATSKIQTKLNKLAIKEQAQEAKLAEVEAEEAAAEALALQNVEEIKAAEVNRFVKK